MAHEIPPEIIAEPLKLAMSGAQAAVPLDDDERATLHRMAHQVDELYRLMLAWRPIVEAWQRGGVLGARSAARRGNRG